MDKKRQKIDEIREQIEQDRYKGLSINRIPKDTKEEFMALARAEYCDDYGMTLKAVMSKWKDSKNLKDIKYKLQQLDSRISILEQYTAQQIESDQGDEDGDAINKIRMCNGKTLEVEKR